MAATPEILRQRAALIAKTREFFADRQVLEVDTPLLAGGVVVEAAIDPIPCRVQSGGETSTHYLLTSPEAPMKRLLAAGSGPIYQLAHAFRDGEIGRRHAVEFTMLEWYRPGFDHYRLMAEVADLVRELLPRWRNTPFGNRSYRELFVEHAGIDPFDTSLAELRACCHRLAIPLPHTFDSGSIDDALDLILVTHIEPRLGRDAPLFVDDYPESQAALARVATDAHGNRVARRFELYVDAVELANGYFELVDATEQRARFEHANHERTALGKAALPIDEGLLAALDDGFPSCSGVALGFDRLVMLATGADDIADVRA